MSILLDTNICIAYLSGTVKNVQKRLLSRTPDEICLCSVVKAELLYGARNSTNVAANMARLERFFAPLPSLPFDDEAADWYGSIRAQLKREGTPIGSNDLMIAAIARARDAKIVTRNQSEFRRVIGLQVEVW